MAKDYRALRKIGQTDIVCFNFGKKGHMAKDCKVPRGGYYGGQAHLNAIIPNEAEYEEAE